MKVLHAASMKECSIGILNQMVWEQDAAIELKILWDVKIFVPNDKQYGDNSNVIVKAKKNSHEYTNLEFRREYYEWLFSQENNFDCFVLRYNSFDYQQLMFIKKIKKPVYLVHHTLELPELKSGKTVKSKVQYFLELLIGQYSIRAAKGTIAVTEEIFNYEISRVPNIFKNKIIYSNGIMYHKNFQVLDSRGDIPEIVFIASYFYEWHGLDLLLNDLKKTQENFKLHIVGSVSENDIRLINFDSRVILHGQLNEQHINKIMQKSWIGLGSFALYRKEMHEACTLKVREYLRSGLPVYSGHHDMFEESFQYYKYGKPHFESILKYCYSMRKIEKAKVSYESEPYISKVNLLKELYQIVSKDN